MKILLVILFAILLQIGCKSEDKSQVGLKDSESKGSLFIIGGGSRPDEMVKRMIEESGINDQGYMVILPMSSELPDSAIIWSSEQFLKQGVAHVTGFNFKKEEIPSAQWIDSLANASLIYISGGNQNRFMEIVGGNEIEEAIHHAYKRGAMIAGTSAGAAVMSQVMITGNELKSPDYRPTFRTIESDNIETANGLGLITTAIIDQHFVWRSRYNRLFSAVIEFPQLKGIGIDESTAILVKNDQAEVVGISQVIVFTNPENSYLEKDGKLAARNININIYLTGEKFPIH